MIFSFFSKQKVVSGVKGQNMVQNDKKFCLSCCIWGTIHDMIFIYSTLVQNENISSCFFFFFLFSKFWIFGLLGGYKVKIGYKMINSSVSHVRYLRSHPSYISSHTWYDCHLWYTCKMTTSSGIFFIFFLNFNYQGG